MWYSGLNWYDKSVGSPSVRRDAASRMAAFRTMNGEPSFGAEPVRETIRLNSTGPTVVAWQKVLGMTPSGIFDNETQEKTKNYQRGKNIDVDGVVGPGTWGTVPISSTSNVLSTLKSRLSQSGPVVAVASALVAGGILAATLSPVPQRSK
jgi:hypothetical protein